MFRWILNLANRLITLAVALAILACGAYSGFALWDNRQVYAEAEHVQQEILTLKPRKAEGEQAEAQAPSFAQLLAINPDVCAWVEMEGTAIDHPVLQGEDNLSYINTDVYGNFALAGSIFLDSRNQRDFQDSVSLLYGHHMENHAMFGDLDLYKDAEFFQQHRTGTLMTPDTQYALETLAVLVLDAGDDVYFEPQAWNGKLDTFLAYTRENAMYIHAETMDELEQRVAEDAQQAPRLLVLSTCSSEFSNARTLVLTWMREYEED